MTREWKPGDVALVVCSDGVARTALVAEPSRDVDGANFIFPSGGRRYAAASQARPLLVIDPEDREQVVRLCATVVSHASTSGSHIELRVSDVQAALRSLVAGPKPEEPLGLGAVVEDGEGIKWVQVFEDDQPWISEHRRPAKVRARACWSQIDVVRVLSEGVPS